MLLLSLSAPTRQAPNLPLTTVKRTISDYKMKARYDRELLMALS